MIRYGILWTAVQLLHVLGRLAGRGTGMNRNAAADVSSKQHPGLAPTSWTMVRAAANASATQKAAALESLLQLYRPVLRQHLTRVWRLPDHQAEDYLQDFIMAKFLEK